MMLLLSGHGRYGVFSYDADGDDSTPPVTVEFNGLYPAKKVFRFPVAFEHGCPARWQRSARHPFFRDR